jgi:hypothetical protein
VPLSQFGWLRKFRPSPLVDSRHLAPTWLLLFQLVFGIALLPIPPLEGVG